MSHHDKCMEDVRRFFATGELPEPWDPESEPEGVVDSWVAEINAELEAIESGSVEPPKLGWLVQIGKHPGNGPHHWTTWKPTHWSRFDGELYQRVRNGYVDEDTWRNGGRQVMDSEADRLQLEELKR